MNLATSIQTGVRLDALQRRGLEDAHLPRLPRRDSSDPTGIVGRVLELYRRMWGKS